MSVFTIQSACAQSSLLISTHSEKGESITRVGNGSSERLVSNEYYDQDTAECENLIYSQGVNTGDSVSTDLEEINTFSDEALQLTLKGIIFERMGRKKVFNEREAAMIDELERIQSEASQCMEELGWSIEVQ
tara:strand:- start:239 stop:634 length:396 start_codon:yes stop_codon:yes gene_type:complete